MLVDKVLTILNKLTIHQFILSILIKDFKQVNSIGFGHNTLNLPFLKPFLTISKEAFTCQREVHLLNLISKGYIF